MYLFCALNNSLWIRDTGKLWAKRIDLEYTHLKLTIREVSWDTEKVHKHNKVEWRHCNYRIVEMTFLKTIFTNVGALNALYLYVMLIKAGNHNVMSFEDLWEPWQQTKTNFFCVMSFNGALFIYWKRSPSLDRSYLKSVTQHELMIGIYHYVYI